MPLALVTRSHRQTGSQNLPDVLPEERTGTRIPKRARTGTEKAHRGKGWDVLRCEYTNARKTKRWLGVAARRGSTAVLLTMVAPEKNFEHYRVTFEAVSESLELGE